MMQNTQYERISERKFQRKAPPQKQFGRARRKTRSICDDVIATETTKIYKTKERISARLTSGTPFPPVVYFPISNKIFLPHPNGAPTLQSRLDKEATFPIFRESPVRNSIHQSIKSLTRLSRHPFSFNLANIIIYLFTYLFILCQQIISGIIQQLTKFNIIKEPQVACTVN